MKLQSASLFKKLIWLFTACLGVSFIVSLFFIQTAIDESYVKKNSEILQKHIDYIKQQDFISLPEKLSSYAKIFGIRLTLLRIDGHVFYDSHQNPVNMENHLNRPEVADAIHGSKHMYRHFSHTLRRDMLYVAAVSGGNVIRAALPMDNIEKQVSAILFRLIVLYALVYLLILLLVFRLTRSIMVPLRNLIHSIETFSSKFQLQHLQANTQDEVEVLTHSFEELLSQISLNIEQLRKMEKLRSEFVANVSHELKTPLTSIMGFIETLETGALEDPKHNRRFLLIIKENVIRLNLLVEDILHLAKIENEKTPIQKVNVVEILTKLLQDQNLTNHPRLSLDNSQKEIWVNINPSELYSAMLNYISNALKYSQEGQISIALTTEKAIAIFAVKDEGVGIAAEHHHRLFERFYRPDKNRSRETGGTGLGLAIVKHVVEKYDGTVGLESTPGHGSRFWFNLPLT